MDIQNETNLAGTTNAESTERARLRRNQRNSRARKQAYIQDLEQRWGKCVQLGAQATVEMQQAARKVQDENRLLRGVIRKLGLDEKALERALDAERLAESKEAKIQTPVPDGNAPNSTISAPSGESMLPDHLEGNPNLVINQEDSSQTLDLYNWLDDLSKIKDAFGVEATSNMFDDFGTQGVQDLSGALLHDSTTLGLGATDLSTQFWPTEEISTMEPLENGEWPLSAYYQYHSQS